MELTLTNAVFSRIPMVLFLRRNKSSRNENLRGFFVEYIKSTGARINQRRGARSPQAHEAWAPLAAPSRLVGPLGLRHLQLQLYLVPFVRKNIKKKSSSRFTIRRRRHHVFFLWRADLESVLGSGEGRSLPLSSPTFLHRQFQMLFTVGE